MGPDDPPWAKMLVYLCMTGDIASKMATGGGAKATVTNMADISTTLIEKLDTHPVYGIWGGDIKAECEELLAKMDA